MRSRSPARRLAVLLAGGLGLTVLVALIVPDLAVAAARIYGLTAGVACALLAIGLISGARPGDAPGLRWRRRRRPPEDPLRELEQLENAISFAQSSRFDLEYRLDPRLREIATDLLAGRRGIDLPAQPEAARVAVGPLLWDRIRGGRPPLEDRAAPGARLDDLESIVAQMEAI
jgi:hypothetical protein